MGLKKTDHPDRTVINIVACVTKFHGQTAAARMVNKQLPRRILIYFGHRAARSMPPETQLSTMHRANWLARNPRPAKKVPALAAGERVFSCIKSKRTRGFHKISP